MKLIHGRIWTGEGQVFEDGYLAFAHGVITALGDMGEPGAAEGECLDVAGRFVTPGLVEPHCHLGLGPEGAGTSDFSETADPVTPQFRGIDAFCPRDPAIPKARRQGITTAVTGPGSTCLIGGQLCAVKLTGEAGDQAALKPCCAIKFALGEAPKETFGGRGRAPATRMGAAWLLRDMLGRAAAYRAALDQGDAPPYDEKCEALLPLLRGEVPAHIHAMRRDDIRMALDLARTYGFRCAILHGNQAGAMLEDIAGAGASLILGPMYFTSRDPEMEGISFAVPALAAERGIPVSVCTDACPGLGSIQLLRACAALSCRAGLSEEQALSAVTLEAAKAAGIDGRVGSLRMGKDADVAVFTGHPLEFSSRAQYLWIDGRRVL